MIKKRVDRRAMEINDDLQKKNKTIVAASSFVNFFGKESLGVKQIRGMGNLFLTEDELYFEMWKPRRILIIQLNTISGVEITKWHLGKSKGHPLLKVIFSNDNGQNDSVAWLIRNLDDWKNLIDQIVEKNVK